MKEKWKAKGHRVNKNLQGLNLDWSMKTTQEIPVAKRDNPLKKTSAEKQYESDLRLYFTANDPQRYTQRGKLHKHN
ncbi:hypothetical protein CEXT_433431 [Caerostris extrusa]|uniref:Uncharacterized protein n=1 Tax=Caerostris extrusa TaxID=172846 RepID=A0AAV4XTQ3_CAEEX|nr:hypothetical protein CEXT_433431 [Caerostris extrusa]